MDRANHSNSVCFPIDNDKNAQVVSALMSRQSFINFLGPENYLPNGSSTPSPG